MLRADPNRIWTSESIEIAHDQSYYIDGEVVLSKSELGTNVVTSNLSKLGTLSELAVHGGTIFFGDVNATFQPIRAKSIVFDENNSVFTITNSNLNANNQISVTVNNDEVVYADQNQITLGNKSNTRRPVKVFGPIKKGDRLESFNEGYRRRLRPYTILERQDGEILANLPDNQFGFIFAYNFFNFKPFEVIRKYLKEMHTKLRPGGVLAMSFNDCDSSKGVDLVERHFCCYTPGYLIIELANSIGYQLIFTQNDGGPSTWVEFQKSGTITSLRAGQALAKILPKPVAKSK
jgi:SAM-dependent methyltransferase